MGTPHVGPQPPFADAVAATFGLGPAMGSLVHVARGAMGQVYRLDTDRGRWAVKELFWGRTGAEAENTRFQLLAADAGVRLPRPIVLSDGDVIADVEGRLVRVYEWVEGGPIDERPAPDQVLDDIGASLARLHAVAHPFSGEPDPWYVEPVGADRVAAAVEVATRTGVIERPPPLDELLGLDKVIASAPAAPLTGCHLDANRANVFASAGGVVLLDWDNAGPSVGSRELGGALLDWATGPDRSPVARSVRRLADAYRAAGGDFVPDDLSTFAVRVSGWLHYVVMCCEHLADRELPADQLAYEAGDILIMLGRPLRVSVLEQTLDALAERPVPGS